MLYKFQSKAASDVIMLQAHGDLVLHALGRNAAPQGIFQLKDLPDLIAKGESLIAEEHHAHERAVAEAKAEGLRPPPMPEVALHQRLWPLLELMRASLAAHTDVAWGI